MTAPSSSESAERNGRLDARSIELRRHIVRMLERGGRGHLASALSLVEIIRVLYDSVLRYRPHEPEWADRDRLVLSKGHGCMALYALLGDKGFFDTREYDRFCQSEGILGGHPEYRKVPGVEASTGALGHGLSIGVGMALAAKHDKRPHRVFVVVGDGECNEGAIWEAALAAVKHGLDNLTVIVDSNKMQSYAATAEVLEMEPLAEKWSAFGFAVREVDGHDVTSLASVFSAVPFFVGKPGAVICHTVKGKGLLRVEGNLDWHHVSRVSPDQLRSLWAALSDGE